MCGACGTRCFNMYPRVMHAVCFLALGLISYVTVCAETNVATNCLVKAENTHLTCKCSPNDTFTNGSNKCHARCKCRVTEPITMLGAYSAWGAGSFVATLIVLLVVFFVIYAREEEKNNTGTEVDQCLAYRSLTRKKLEQHAAKKQNIYERIPYRPSRQNDNSPLIEPTGTDDEEDEDDDV